MTPIGGKTAKKATTITDQACCVSPSNKNPASSGYNHQFSSSRALIWAQAQLPSSICSGEISRTMTPIWEKRVKMAATIIFQVCRISPTLTNTQHYLGVTTNFSLQELKFERKCSFLAWFVQEILVEPWHHFEKKGQKRPPPSLIRFAAFLPLSDKYPASSKYNHLFPFSRASIWV